MELRIQSLQQQLVDLGYHYAIKGDSVLLVEKLVADLIETTDNLRKYMQIAQEAIEERDALKFGAEPYKCDNAKLTQQCNDLHLKLIDAKESHAKDVRDLKRTLCKLEKEREEFIASNKKQRERIRELELDAVRKSSRHTSSSNILPCSTKKSKEFEAAMAMTEQKVSSLTREVCKLKQQQLELCAINDELKSKLTHREKEITRLNRMLEGGRPLDALTNECCYQEIQREMKGKQEEIKFLQKSKSEMEIKLKDARNKQHEAMKHALSLAERNTQLEKELRDIDQMALTVEQECNDSKKTCDVKMKKMQERLQSALIELQSLEKELQTMRIEKEQMRADLDAARIEKRHLQGILEDSLEDKKSLSDKINCFTIIEQDLNKEIDRLVQQTAEQTRTIADLKGQLMVMRSRESKLIPLPVDSENDQPRMRTCRKKSPPVKSSKQKENKKPSTSKSPSPTRRQSSRGTKPPTNTPTSPCANSDYAEYVDRIKSERDFYVREYKALLEKMRNGSNTLGRNYNLNIQNSLENYNLREAPQREREVNVERETNHFTYSNAANDEVRELKEQVSQLRVESLNLSKEKHNLLQRLENVRDYSDATEYLTLKATSKRVERERDILKADVDRLEEERDNMKHRVKITSEMHASEIERYKKLISDLEEQLRKVDKERYDVLQNQGSRRATITNLEDQVETLKAQLKSCSDELIHHKTIYTQLKVLHEQTDRALADSQNHLLQAEQQLSSYEQKHNANDNKTATLNKDIQRLKSDIDQLTKNLVEVEREKDNLLLQLDEKTENIVALQDELRAKNHEVEELRHQSSDLKQKISTSVDEKNTKDCQLKCKNNDISQLKRDLEAALKSKENCVQENKRIQEELSSALLNNRQMKCELEVAKRQITDLKMQLQHYCAEVKRIEDMMATKEVERSEMLDQFRNLSQEANVLENNNHSLESEATQSRFQLSVALDHAGELEQIIAQQKIVIQNYEKQIADLTAQIATLEMQLKHSQLQQDRTSMEISSLRELCAKLDKQKDKLSQEVQEKEFMTSKTRDELDNLRRSAEIANITAEKEQNTTRTMETILSDTRQQLVEQRLVNQELQQQVINFKGQIAEMEQNLTLATERLDMYQEKALDYSKQNTQLRREIVNERFTQSQDDSSRRYPSL